MAGINGDGLNERSRLCSGSSGGNYRTLADTDDNMGLSREDLSKYPRISTAHSLPLSVCLSDSLPLSVCLSMYG